jgi:hypothetical protein
VEVDGFEVTTAGGEVVRAWRLLVSTVSTNTFVKV